MHSADLARRILDALATTPGDVVIEAPAEGPGHWAGAPSALQHKGVHWLTYRVRLPEQLGRGRRTVVARSDDGLSFQTVTEVHAQDFGAASLERPAIVHVPATDSWRLYISCAAPYSKHWWVEAIDARHPSDFAAGQRTVVLYGDPDTEALKDPVIWHDGSQWQMWICRHLLDQGPDQADRMMSQHLVSDDGLHWEPTGRELHPVPHSWEQRGARVTSQVGGIVLYDGRASAEENFHERTGAADPATGQRLGGPVPADEIRAIRYLSVCQTPQGTRLYWEAERPDGSNELRTTLLT